MTPPPAISVDEPDPACGDDAIERIAGVAIFLERGKDEGMIVFIVRRDSSGSYGFVGWHGQCTPCVQHLRTGQIWHADLGV